jgi:hypothetical protein
MNAFYNFSGSCTVTEGISGKIMPCIFPFRYNGQDFSECITIDDPEYKLWCSTRVDETGEHVPDGGFWGHCGPECEENKIIQPELSIAPPGNQLIFELNLQNIN